MNELKDFKKIDNGFVTNTNGHDYKRAKKRNLFFKQHTKAESAVKFVTETFQKDKKKQLAKDKYREEELNKRVDGLQDIIRDEITKRKVIEEQYNDINISYINNKHIIENMENLMTDMRKKFNLLLTMIDPDITILPQDLPDPISDNSPGITVDSTIINGKPKKIK